MWQLWRQDDHGNEFLVRELPDRAEAERLRDDFLARGHHQHYWVTRAPSDENGEASPPADAGGR